MRDSLDLPAPAPSTFSPPRRSAAPQLLIEMSAETAARLLARSLLDQVVQLAGPESEHAELAAMPRPDGWRAAFDRLNACMSLYSKKLAGSISRKSRRRVRELSRQAERLHRAEIQLAWLGRFAQALPTGPASPAVEVRDDVAAAVWLRARVARRRPTIASVRRTNRDVAKLRRLSKSLGVYTTAVRLDDMPAPQSFAALTGGLMRAESDRLRNSLAGMRRDGMRPTKVRSVRRALIASRRLSYLLEPVRVHVDGVARVAERLVALQASLNRLAELVAVANALLRAGRRAGGLHLTSLVRAELFAAPEEATDSGTRDLRPGLLALARQLAAEIAPAFERFGAQWGEETTAGLAVDLEACAVQLGE